MDPIVSFKAALLQAREAELAVRADCLTELDDISAQKNFRKDLEETLSKLRERGAISGDPLNEFLGQCSQVIGWQTKLVEQESYFAERMRESFEAIEASIEDGLPDEEWSALENNIAGLEAEFLASREEWQGSLPADLWQVTEGDRQAALDKLDALLGHARDTMKLNKDVGWSYAWRLTADTSGPSLADNEVDIPAECSFCGHTWTAHFGQAGKTVNCLECSRDVKLPDALAAKKNAEDRAAKKTIPPVKVPGAPDEKHTGLPSGWKDHFDSNEEAKTRLASRPYFDTEELERLRAKATEVAERKEIWQKYLPRMQATHLPFNTDQAWELIVRDPGEVVAELTDYWPESDWALSPRIGQLLGGGDMDISQGVALLATDKEKLERQTIREIRQRVEANPQNAILDPGDYFWICREDEKVKLVYTEKLEKKCADYNWKHNFEVDEELEDAFKQGMSVEDALGLLLKGKSRKQDLSADDISKVFNEIRRVKEINGDLFADDGSNLRGVSQLPHDWRFNFWEPAEFESEQWIKDNPIVATRLMISELPQIVAEFTGREKLFRFREKAEQMLEDEDLSIQQKAMLLPVMIGISDQVLFISEREGEITDPGSKPGPLKMEVDRSFRSSEVRGLLDSEFPQKLADYCEQNWILDTLESQANTRKEGMAWGAKIGVGVVVLIVLSLIVTFIMERIRASKNNTQMAEVEARNAMAVDYSLDMSLVPTNIAASNIVAKVGGAPIDTTTKFEEGDYTFVIDHPALKTVRLPFNISYGVGTNFGQIKLSPATGSLSIASDPNGASVAVNGDAVGETPYSVKSINAGPAKITLSSPEFGTWTTNATIGKDQVLTINYRFGRGTVKITSNPTGFFVATGPAGTSAAALDWASAAKTPLEAQMLPGEYVVSLAHPTMGSIDATQFTIRDQEETAFNQDFPVASPNLSPGADAQYWRGSFSLGTWMNWEDSWQFSTKNPLTLFRLWKPGRYPGVYPLENNGGFTSRVKNPLGPGGTIEAWGSDSRKQTTIPDAVKDRKFIDIAAGANHTVGLLDDMSVVCWGDNKAGQCAIPEDLGPCMMVAAGADHTVALQINGKVVCWGANQSGQSAVPDGMPSSVAISASANRTVALLANGSIQGWGYGGFTIAATSQWRPFIDVSVGAYYIATLNDLGEPTVYIQTNTGTSQESEMTTVLREKGSFVAATGGTGHTIWMTQAGNFMTLGRERNIPKVPGVGPFATIQGAFERQAATTASGTAIIWGRKSGMSTRSGFERATDEANKASYWQKSGQYYRIVCGEKHYVALRR